MKRIAAAWRWLASHWKAVFGGLSILLVLIYTGLSNRNRGKAIDAKRKAHQAGQEKTEAATDAKHYQAKASAHGKQAEAHQERARAVVEKLRTKEQHNPNLADARALAERLRSRGEE